MDPNQNNNIRVLNEKRRQTEDESMMMEFNKIVMIEIDDSNSCTEREYVRCLLV